MSVRPSVCLCMLNCKQSTGRIYDPNWTKFGTTHLFGPRNLLKLGKIGSDLDIAPIYIFVRFKVNGAPKSLNIFRFARNLAQRNELGLECV